MRITILALLFISFSFLGCATFTIDGKPIPGHTYTQINPRTGIKTDSLLVRYLEKTEGKEKFLWPDYLEFNKDLVLPSDTNELYISLQIVNIGKVTYRLKKKYTVYVEPYSYTVSQTLSISKHQNRVHNIKLPIIKDAKINFDLRLYDKKGSFIMKFGEVKYIIKGGDEESLEGSIKGSNFLRET